MAKKSNVRTITASEKARGLVDRGYSVDVEMKNLGFEDKGIKKMLAGELEGEFEADSSIRVKGVEGAAVVTQSEKFEIKGDADKVDAVRKDVDKGLLGDVVKVEEVLNVPVADRAKAATILQAAGIKATTSVKLSVDPEEFRVMSSSESESIEALRAAKALKEVVERSVSYRVKYEKA